MASSSKFLPSLPRPSRRRFRPVSPSPRAAAPWSSGCRAGTLAKPSEEKRRPIGASTVHHWARSDGGARRRRHEERTTICMPRDWICRRKMQRRRCSEEKWQLRWFRDSQPPKWPNFRRRNIREIPAGNKAKTVNPINPHLETAEQTNPLEAIQDLK